MPWSTEPVGGRPLYFWYAITACCVVRPYDPSAPESQKPRSSRRCCNAAVEDPPLWPTATMGDGAGPTGTLFDGRVTPDVVAVVDGSGLSTVVVVARVVVGASVVEVVVDAFVGGVATSVVFGAFATWVVAQPARAINATTTAARRPRDLTR